MKLMKVTKQLKIERNQDCSAAQNHRVTASPHRHIAWQSETRAQSAIDECHQKSRPFNEYFRSSFNRPKRRTIPTLIQIEAMHSSK
jgi:hypothetical protein